MARNSLSVLIGKLRRRRRKYPIKRDEWGRSARRQALDLFEHGKMPAQVALIVGVSVRTARRYFQDWKKLPRNLESKYMVAKKLLNSSPGYREKVVKTICELPGLPEEGLSKVPRALGA